MKKKEANWFVSFVLALAIAVFVRWFAFEHFAVVSSSMESTILTGDHIIVNKFCYGARTPITPLQIPITHRNFLGNIKAFSSLIQLPSFRLPSFSPIKAGDIIVFNYPAEIGYPVDMREYYIKRCIGLAGDVVYIKNADVFVNEEPFFNIETTQFRFFLESKDRLHNFFFDSHSINEFFKIDTGYEVFTSLKNAKILLKKKIFDNILLLATPQDYVENNLFMNKSSLYEFYYNADWFGPVKVPKKGLVIGIDRKNLALYGYNILNHEHTKAKIINNELFIEGVRVQKYTFKQDYFFVLGDNRHNSLDSRYWGFVPHDHLVGKASFVFLSVNNKASHFWQKIRIKRFFKTLY